MSLIKTARENRLKALEGLKVRKEANVAKFSSSRLLDVERNIFAGIELANAA